MTKRAVYIGRYSPFHKGHFTIMKQKWDEGKPLLVLVRDTHYDLYPAEMRKRMIEAAFARINADAKVMIIDDIESVNYGRGVGYEVNEIEAPKDIKMISATDIRKRIEQGDESWRQFMPEGADTVLEKYLKNSGLVVWFTGLPKAGKKTIANLVREKLEKRGVLAERLDGGILRETVSKDLTFSKQDRDTNLERATYIAKLLSRNGGVVLASFVTPYKAEREKIRKELEEKAQFLEVHVKASVETCKQRDDTGMYAQAEKGELEEFTGVNAPYDEPEKPELVLDTEKLGPEEAANEVVKQIDALLKK